MMQTSPGRVRSFSVSLPINRSGLGLGTGVLTTEGELPIEFLMPGDRVVTHDRGAVALSNVIVRDVPREQVLRIRPSVVDPRGAGRDILIAAQNRVLLRDWRARAMFARPAVLLAAHRLVDGAHITRLEGPGKVRLLQLVFDDGEHLVQIAGGRFQVSSARLSHRAEAGTRAAPR